MSHAELARTAAPVGAARMPDFFVVGHPKCGTTALYEMLRRHPEIFMPALKEPHFFAADMQLRFQPRAAAEVPQTLDQYAELFRAAAPGQRLGEASSSYLWSQSAAAAIAQVQPQARIVAILREPASFLRSLHMQLLQTHVEDERDLRAALDLEPARREGRRIPPRSHRPQLLLYSEHVRYTEQLARYDAAFAPEQLLVLIYDDFRADNEAAVRAVLRHIGVDAERPVQALEANTTTRSMRSQRLDALLHAVSVGNGAAPRAVRGAVKALTPRRLRRGALALTQRRIVQGPPLAVDEALMRELRVRFAPEVRALGDRLGRDLAELWGYDRLR